MRAFSVLHGTSVGVTRSTRGISLEGGRRGVVLIKKKKAAIAVKEVGRKRHFSGSICVDEKATLLGWGAVLVFGRGRR